MELLCAKFFAAEKVSRHEKYKSTNAVPAHCGEQWLTWMSVMITMLALDLSQCMHTTLSHNLDLYM